MTTCPGCRGPMNRQRYEGVTIDRCPGCGGTWLDDQEIGQIASAREATFEEQAKRVAISTKGQDARKTKAQCPKCGDPLETMNYMFNSGVIVDRCAKKHGFFLDNGELEKLQIVVEEFEHRANPGLMNSKSSASNKLCPRDNCALVVHMYEGVEIDTCPQCAGVWCDGDEMGKIVQRQIQAFKETDHAHIKASESSATVVMEFDLVMSLPCPVCRTRMNRTNYQYSSGIVIDRCSHGHGVWLDSSELEHVQVFSERWSAQSPELDRKYKAALNQAAIDAEAGLEKAVKAGRERGRNASMFGRVAKFMSGK